MKSNGGLVLFFDDMSSPVVYIGHDNVQCARLKVQKYVERPVRGGSAHLYTRTHTHTHFLPRPWAPCELGLVPPGAPTWVVAPGGSGFRRAPATRGNSGGSCPLTSNCACAASSLAFPHLFLVIVPVSAVSSPGCVLRCS